MSTWKGYRITSEFGYRTHPITGKKGSFHTGIDLVKSHRAPIQAFIGGKVIYAGLGRTGTGFGGYGNVVLIEDSNGRGNVYAHLDSVSVKKGQVVKAGDVIGRQGNTGQSTGSHLHFEIRKKVQNRIPYGWIADRANNCLEPTTYVDNYVDRIKLKIDGKWGNNTTKALQQALGTTVDGYLSDQTKNTVTTSLYGSTVKFGNGSKGSLVIKALQRKLGGLKVDGLLGQATVRRLQANLGTVRDGKLSRPSLVVKELQRHLNAGTF